MAPGTVTISVTDPKTGISSHAGGGDATFTVLGALGADHPRAERVHAHGRPDAALTATGHYAGGTTRNLTQHLVYRTSNAAVAAAPNTEGDKSRVDVVGTGSAIISAVDPATGISSAKRWGR